MYSDPFFYYISLIEDGDLYTTSDVLTLKRVHNIGFYRTLNSSDFNNRVFNLYIHYVMSSSVIRDLLKIMNNDYTNKYIRLYFLHKMELAALTSLIGSDLKLSDFLLH